MKKLFIVMLSLLITLWVYVMEGGRVTTLIALTTIPPIFLGTFLSTLFTYKLGEITHTFKAAFTERADSSELESYRLGVLVVKNMESATVFWSVTIVIMALILILNHLTNPQELGPSIAMAFLSPLYAFGLRASVYVPMENSLRKKIFLAEKASGYV